MRRSNLTLLTVVAFGLLSVSSCGSNSASPVTSSQSPSGGPTVPDLVGTWTGTHDCAVGTAAHPRVITTTEKLIFAHQQGTLIWGEDTYRPKGQTEPTVLRGSIDSDGKALTLVEVGGFFRAEIQPDGTLLARFTRTDSTPTTFEFQLSRSGETPAAASPS